MKKRSVAVSLFIAAMLLASPALGLDFDFSGTFTHDNDIVRLNFTVGQASTVTVFSSSWDEGGFDPILAIWDSTGYLKYEQDDGGVVGSTLSNGVSYTHGVWDSYYQVSLDPGSYIATIGQYDNFANGTYLSDGFTYDNDQDFTTAYGPQPYFNGVWTGDDSRTGDWAFHILNVAAAQQQPVPEPATMVLLAAGLIGLAGARRRMKK